MIDKIKVLHIVSGDLNGGAARGAYWLSQGLLNQGVDSRILLGGSQTNNDPHVESFLKSKWKKSLVLIHQQIDKIPLLLYKESKNFFFSTGLGGIDISKHFLYDWADVIHLHWLNNGFINIRYFKKIKKPIVWTLRDMWPFTGGCHYSFGCEKYKDSCGNCPQLGSNSKNDLSRLVFKMKRKYLPESIKIVGISPWITEKAQESNLFKNYTIKTIYNSINCDQFFPVPQNLALEILGIVTTKKIILIGAHNINMFYKGFNKFLESLMYLDPTKFYICFFGEIHEDVSSLMDFEYKCFGYLSDIISLRILYSAADVFIAPSIEEAFGKTIVESMACGTPVVCFDSTGPKSIIKHGVDGYKAVPFESKDLANGIKWIVDYENYNQLSKSARENAVNKFDYNVIARQYLELYNDII